MSNTPDLDKAREAAKVFFGWLRARTLRVSNEDVARLILEQRAEEAERAHTMIHVKKPCVHWTRAADLRRQAAGGEK